MTAATDPRAVAVVWAIRRSIETSGGPGLAVNGHPNPFFVNVTGAIDLHRAAEFAVKAIDLHDEAVKAAAAKAEAEAAKAEADALAKLEKDLKAVQGTAAAKAAAKASAQS